MTPYYSDDAVTLFCGDALEVLREMPDQSVDMAIADPPYNVGKDYGAHDDRMEPALYESWLSVIFWEVARVSRHGLIYFPGTANLFRAPTILPKSLPIKRVLGWHRKEFAGDLWSGGPAMSWEPVIWATGEPFYVKRFGSHGRDFLVVPSIHGNPFAAEHPCPKPEPVMRWLVGLFVPPDGSVLDPFAGTGTTLRAAKDLGRTAIGIENHPAYCDLTVRRLSQETLGLSA